MGSEHYCLRWNNHQSNLLGVFSQLLQDESLVDVTLSCSEGAPIRAHKVVLSACSSYFQSLFQDHPEKHPIVILKDVRLAELQTLVEFMYKGEVNVQYCQLSALIKTAQSLKVKGLADMINQNTLREPERERDREPERLRPHSQLSKSGVGATCDSPVDAVLPGPSTSSSAPTGSAATATVNATSSSATSSAAVSANATSGPGTNSSSSSTSTPATAHSSNKRDACDRGSPSPPKRLLASSIAREQDSPLPLDLYHRRAELEESGASDTNGDRTVRSNEVNKTSSSEKSNRSHTPNAAGSGGGSASGTSNLYNNNDDRDYLHSPDRPTSCDSHAGGGGDGGGTLTKIEDDPEDYDEEMDLDDEGDNSSTEMGLNMKISHSATTLSTASPHTGGLGSGGGGIGGDAESARSTPGATASSSGLLPSDLTQRPASRSSRDGSIHGSHSVSDRPSSSGVCGLPSTSVSSLATVGGGLSPASSVAAGGFVGSESLASHSGLGPVQSVPLSLKKEIDCSEDDNSNSRHMQPRSASAGGGLGGEMDYRASHESETSESPHGIIGSGSGCVSAVGVGSGSSGATSSGAGGGSGSAAHSGYDRPQTPPMYRCIYCPASFPHQSKLTRHILSHSLKTLEYRDTATHPLLQTHLLPPDLSLPALPQHIAYQMNAAMAAGADPHDQAAAVAAVIEMDIAAAVAAAGGCAALSGITGCGPRMDLDGSGSGAPGSSSSGGGGRGGSGIGSSSAGNGAGSSSSSGLLLSSSSASSTSAAAAAATAASSSSSSLLGTSSDPNSVVLCKFCGKSFPDVASLIAHLPVHTGDRPFKCEFCGKAFKLRHHMKDHCRVHTGERPFRCHMCGKTFSRSTILKAHEKTHFPKYVRKFLSPSPVDTKDDIPQ